MFTWGELKEIVHTGELEQLQRNKEMQRKYDIWSAGIKQEYGSTGGFGHLATTHPSRDDFAERIIYSIRNPGSALRHRLCVTTALIGREVPHRRAIALGADHPAGHLPF
jgi:hypothetical protein